MVGINTIFNNTLRCIVTAVVLMGIPAAAAALVVEQKTFETPEQAVDSLIAANRNDNETEILHILGSHADKLIHSGDKAEDKASRKKFLAAYDAAHTLKSESPDKELLIVGNHQWPLPIPLIRQNNRWWFDSAAGEQEILNRRIGRNELNVIEVSRAYVEAQREYAQAHTLANGKHEYAERFVSHSGQHDGLYWPTAAGEPESPLGPLVAFAQAEGLVKTQKRPNEPYHGYYYKILTSQSANAPDGAKNYISDGHMTEGFALIAFPAKYGDSGIMTFIVSHNGIVHEKNLGENTAEIAAQQIKQYDPDDSWKLLP